MKWDGDRYLIACLTGAFADAMYGSEQSFIKKKYAKDGQTFHYNEILTIGERYGYHHVFCPPKKYNSCQNKAIYQLDVHLFLLNYHRY